MKDKKLNTYLLCVFITPFTTKSLLSFVLFKDLSYPQSMISVYA